MGRLAGHVQSAGGVRSLLFGMAPMVTFLVMSVLVFGFFHSTQISITKRELNKVRLEVIRNHGTEERARDFAFKNLQQQPRIRKCLQMVKPPRVHSYPLKPLAHAIPTKHGFLVAGVDPGVDHYVAAGILQRGDWDPEVTMMLGKHSNECYGSTPENPRYALDIGGNVGFHTMFLRQRGCEVATVEAQPRIKQHIDAGVCLNDWDRVHVFNNVIHENPGQTMVMPDCSSMENPGGCSMLHANVPGDEVTSIRVDDIPDRLGWEGDIEVAKMDIEGYEIHGIKSMRKLLETRRLKALVMEFSPAGWTQEERADAEATLTQFLNYGYTVSEGRAPSPDNDDDRGARGADHLSRAPRRRTTSTETCPLCKSSTSSSTAGTSSNRSPTGNAATSARRPKTVNGSKTMGTTASPLSCSSANKRARLDVRCQSAARAAIGSLGSLSRSGECGLAAC